MRFLNIFFSIMFFVLFSSVSMASHFIYQCPEINQIYRSDNSWILATTHFNNVQVSWGGWVLDKKTTLPANYTGVNIDRSFLTCQYKDPNGVAAEMFPIDGYEIEGSAGGPWSNGNCHSSNPEDCTFYFKKK